MWQSHIHKEASAFNLYLIWLNTAGIDMDGYKGTVWKWRIMTRNQ